MQKHYTAKLIMRIDQLCDVVTNGLQDLRGLYGLPPP